MMEITYSLSSHWSVFYLGKILVWVVLIYSMSLWEVMSLLHPCVFVGKCRLMSCKDYLFMWLQYLDWSKFETVCTCYNYQLNDFSVYEFNWVPFSFLFSISNENIWTHDALVFFIRGGCKCNVCILLSQSVDHLAALFVSTCRVLRRHLLIVCCGFLELAIIASLSE